MTKTYSNKNIWTVFLLAFFLGPIGAHRFYVGKTMTGLLMILFAFVFPVITGIVWIVDILRIISGSFKDKEGDYINNNIF